MLILKKGNLIGKVFMDGVKVQLEQEWTWAAAATIGLYQGLKYKGNIKTGVAGGLAVLVVLSGASGVYNVVRNWSSIKETVGK